jgi:nucleotide-binding universal stress UspA family protein
MNILRNILVAVDFSTASRAALQQAARLALLSKAKLYVLHVVDAEAVETLAEMLGDGFEHQAARSLESAAAVLPRWAERSELPADYDSTVVAGDPLHEILDHVVSTHADLIVAGIIGRHGAARGTGAVSAKLARKSPVPILLVRPDHAQPFRKITACVDFSSHSQEVIQQAFRIAAQDGAKLDFLHVWREPWVVMPEGDMFGEAEPPVIIFTEKERLQYMENLRRRLHVLVAGGQRSLPHSEVLREAMSYGSGIQMHAQETGTELLVIGGGSRTALREMLLGSTAEQMLAQTSCSLLLVKTASSTQPF